MRLLLFIYVSVVCWLFWVVCIVVCCVFCVIIVFNSCGCVLVLLRLVWCLAFDFICEVTGLVLLLLGYLWFGICASLNCLLFIGFFDLCWLWFWWLFCCLCGCLLVMFRFVWIGGFVDYVLFVVFCYFGHFIWFLLLLACCCAVCFGLLVCCFVFVNLGCSGVYGLVATFLLVLLNSVVMCTCFWLFSHCWLLVVVFVMLVIVLLFGYCLSSVFIDFVIMFVYFVIYDCCVCYAFRW